MLRPGLHLSNAIGITNADLDHIKRWKPLSALLAMHNIVYGDTDLLKRAWELADRPPLVLRYYYTPKEGGPAYWEKHARDNVEMAHRCAAHGIPLEHLIFKPFNEPNMPRWADAWEGFGSEAGDIARYNQALNIFIDVAKNEVPEVRIGGPHLTIGNRDCRFQVDQPGDYYYHGADGKFESSICAESLSRLDVHFVHCYSFYPDQWRQRAFGLRFAEYEKYFKGKDILSVMESALKTPRVKKKEGGRSIKLIAPITESEYVLGKRMEQRNPYLNHLRR